MIKYVGALALLALIGVGGFFALNAYIYSEKQGGGIDYRNATYSIQGSLLTLVDGEATEMRGEGSSQSNTVTRIFGNETRGDLNDDGKADSAFILTQSSGGSGTFYYVAVAMQNAGGKYEGMNAILLGDRIAPQTTEIRNGILIVNYADRNLNEPMTTAPSRGISLYAYFDGENMLAIPTIGAISIEGTITCLTPWNIDEPQTTECAIGLIDDLNRQFALIDTDPSNAHLSQIENGDRVAVEGQFKLQLGAHYHSVGVIEVLKISPLRTDHDMSIRLYYYNAQKDRDASGNSMCSRDGLEYVERRISKTSMPLTEALSLLMRGEISVEEKARGITSEFPLVGVTLKSAVINNGIATLVFDDPQNTTVGGSCRTAILWAQIEATARQFPTVTEVRFLPEELFQP